MKSPRDLWVFGLFFCVCDCVGESLPHVSSTWVRLFGARPWGTLIFSDVMPSSSCVLQCILNTRKDATVKYERRAQVFVVPRWQNEVEGDDETCTKAWTWMVPTSIWEGRSMHEDKKAMRGGQRKDEAAEEDRPCYSKIVASWAGWYCIFKRNILHYCAGNVSKRRQITLFCFCLLSETFPAHQKSIFLSKMPRCSAVGFFTWS